MSKRLKRIQRGFRGSTLEQLNPDDSWSQWLPIPTEPQTSAKNAFHIFDVDRFLSIYNRPVRRRQITHEPGAHFPSTRVVRNPADGTYYLLGADRTDTDSGLVVETLTTLHQVNTTGSVKRRQLAESATESDPGWLDEVDIGVFYFDSELRTVSEESEYASEHVGKYFLFTNCDTLKENDVITLADNTEYLVEMPYKDAGFNCARVARLKDSRSNIRIQRVTAAATTTNTGWNPYNPDSTSSVADKQTFDVTAWIGHSMMSPIADSASLDSLIVFIDKSAIGFEPETSSNVTVEGSEYRVVEAKYSHLFEQYRLDCERV